MTLSDRVRGCLLGGAVGDALGAPVEFMKWDDIREEFGEHGIQEYAVAFGRAGAITDDTQMTLFTAEGLLRAKESSSNGPLKEVRLAYLRWYQSQEGTWSEFRKAEGLLENREMWSCRAPGNTCIASLRKMSNGTSSRNSSEGCGTVMRVAPVGLLYSDRAWELGAQTSLLTHGGDGALYAGAFFADLIAQLVRGKDLNVSIADTCGRHYHEVHVRQIADACVQAAVSNSPPTPARIEKLGGGWTAMEALCIALYVSLTTETFEQAVRAAVNHSGDSDSTGSLVGQIKGTMLGVDAIPPRWTRRLELCSVIKSMADDITRRVDSCPSSPV